VSTGKWLPSFRRNLVPSSAFLVYYMTLKKKAPGTNETSTQSNIPEDLHCYQHFCKDVKYNNTFEYKIYTDTEVKIKLSLFTPRGNRGRAPPLLRFGARFRQMVFTLRPSYHRARTPVPIEQEALWIPQPVRTCL